MKNIGICACCMYWVTEYVANSQSSNNISEVICPCCTSVNDFPYFWLTLMSNCIFAFVHQMSIPHTAVVSGSKLIHLWFSGRPLLLFFMTRYFCHPLSDQFELWTQCVDKSWIIKKLLFYALYVCNSEAFWSFWLTVQIIGSHWLHVPQWKVWFQWSLFR